MHFKSQLEEKVFKALQCEGFLLSGFELEKEKLWQELFDDHRGKEAVDFYFKHIRLIIEVHGEQHYQPVSFSGKTDSIEAYRKQSKRDRKLKALCRENEINYIELSYDVIRESDIDELAILIDKEIVQILLKE